MQRPPYFILASGSPRRRQLLSSVGLAFEVVESGIDESQEEGETPEQYAIRMASEKAKAVSQKLRGTLVLGADTVVDLDGEVLGKPANAEEAMAMLKRLAGRTHQVITAVALARDGLVIDSDVSVSKVTFRPLSDEEIYAYTLSGEPYDKAGGYGIQGLGGSFVQKVVGSYTNVMGLPLETVLHKLKRHLIGDNPDTEPAASGS